MGLFKKNIYNPQISSKKLNNEYEFIFDRGWSPVLGPIIDNHKVYLKLLNWIGGEGEMPFDPTTNTYYLSSTGFVTSLIDATPISIYADAPSGMYIFENGLTENLGNVELGGELTKNTSITSDTNKTFDITLTNSTFTSLFHYESGGIFLRSERNNADIFSDLNLGPNTISLRTEDGSLKYCELYYDSINKLFVFKNNINNKGIEYLADYSANYTNRTLVDKEYVDNLQPYSLEIINTLENGWTGSLYIHHRGKQITITAELNPLNATNKQFYSNANIVPNYHNLTTPLFSENNNNLLIGSVRIEGGDFWVDTTTYDNTQGLSMILNFNITYFTV